MQDTLKYKTKKKPQFWGFFDSVVYHTSWIWPDKLYLKMLYRARVGRELNLQAPHSFCEKIQWLKLYNRNPEYTIMVDKVKVKEYVSSIIGEEYIIPTLGVWDNPDKIDFNSLPEQFVLKCNHNSGLGMYICRDKSTMDQNKVKDGLRKGLKSNYYLVNREWPYKDVPRRILAEQFIAPTSGVQDIPDYKWFCFDGKPMFCQVIQDRSTNETVDFFNTDWEHQNFIGLNPQVTFANTPPSRPVNLDKQISIVSRLSQGIPFSRIDLYEVAGRIYFGEITFFPMSGFGFFRPEEYNEILGQMIKLPSGQK